MISDHQHWTSLKHPLSPSDKDVIVYQSLINAKDVLLLGSTKKLLNLSTVAVDIEPRYIDTKIIKGDWIDLKIYCDNVIGDGCLCFSKSLTDKLLINLKDNVKRFISRSFNHKLPLMKYAEYFPHKDDFLIKPNIVINKIDYSFYVWDF